MAGAPAEGIPMGEGPGGGFRHSGGTPISGRFILESLKLSDDLGVPPWLRKPPGASVIDWSNNTSDWSFQGFENDLFILNDSLGSGAIHFLEFETHFDSQN